MMLKALPLVHFWSVLLLKEQMMTSVIKTLKILVWSAQNRSISSEICLENNHKIGRFLLIAFWWSLPRKLPRNPPKSADFSANLSLKIPRNLTFLPRPIRSPLRKYASFNNSHNNCHRIHKRDISTNTHVQIFYGSLHPLECMPWILLFCIFGDFYASGMQDAEVNKVTAYFFAWTRDY